MLVRVVHMVVDMCHLRCCALCDLCLLVLLLFVVDMCHCVLFGVIVVLDVCYV